MDRTGVQAQSPTLSLVPSENSNGCKAERRVLTERFVRDKLGSMNLIVRLTGLDWGQAS